MGLKISSSYFIELLGGLNELIQEKNLTRMLAYSSWVTRQVITTLEKFRVRNIS